MEKLTAEELIKLAKQLKTIARSINDFQIENWNNLSIEQFNRLNKTERDLLLTINDLITQSVFVLVADSQSLINQVEGITSDINTTLSQISNINKVIRIATASVFFASAIVSSNPAAILLSLQGIQEAIDNDDDDDDDDDDEN